MIYAGAQKIYPAGTTLVIVKKKFLNQVELFQVY
jgi:phosphoserine aminotransferase